MARTRCERKATIVFVRRTGVLLMPTVELDPSLKPVTIDSFRFPLGVYPVEPMVPSSGYVEEFEQADGGPTFWSEDAPTGDDWEEWPDRFMFDVVVSAEKIATFVRALLTMLPTRVYPILDVLGNDAYREVDPYIAYDLVGLDKVFDAIRSFGPWLYEDGLVGFGAMSLEPFCYVFVDEHKIVTVRVELELKERVEKILSAFELSAVPELKGADAAAHEHRGVLVRPEADQQALLVAEEIVDRLRRHWSLQLNIDRVTNVDDDGRDLGITYWRALVRCAENEDGPERFAEALVSAACLDEAEQLIVMQVGRDAPGDDGWFEVEHLAFDRLTPELCAEMLGRQAPALDAARVLRFRWLDQDAGASSGRS